ncbi:DUF4913 domain-containing protein [Arcanobacterium haemolyticum]|nr:DUF4913 domain-containing protein [Arcanobacterium haemolyticum]
MNGLATWFINIADPMMGQFMNPEGPFKKCVDGTHNVLSEDAMHLPFATPPPEYIERCQLFKRLPISWQSRGLTCDERVGEKLVIDKGSNFLSPG